MQTKSILVLTPYYLPGFKAGGPIRAISGVAEALGSEFQFKIICGDRDLGDDKPFDNEPIGVWYNYGQAKVLRLAPGLKGVRKLFDVMRSEDYDIVYLNSIWAYSYSCLPILWRRLGLLPRKPTVISPRGELSEGALSLKPFRKKLYLNLGKRAKIFERVIWQASSGGEKADILRVLGQPGILQATAANVGNHEGLGYAGRSITIATDVAAILESDAGCSHEPKTPGDLRVVTLGRVCRMKNIEYAITLFQHIRGRVTYDIYGPLEDKLYVAKCQRACAKLPENVTVRFMGGIPQDRVLKTLGRYHIFLLPTLGENFGHVMIEALNSGCALVISDRTPWINLEEAGVGWAIPLSAPERFVRSLETALTWSDEDFVLFSEKARMYAADHELYQVALRENRMLFHSVTDFDD
jgi:glycosyltransferase involved in cell wall biosynthesis